MSVILGIDPGSRITGFGVISTQGNKSEYLDSGCIRTSDAVLGTRLLEIFNGICTLMDEYQPTEVAIEQVFMHQNPDSALKLGHARGAAMVAAASHRVALFEYSAREVKLAIAGYGAAEKTQVKHMVMQLLHLTTAPQSDASDALAVALCHSHQRRDAISTAITGSFRRGRR